MTIRLCALTALLLAACGEVVPADQPSAAPPVVDPSDGGAGADGGPTPGPAPRRVVETRSPFGDLNPDNLMLDGDFEFTGRQGQMAWLALAGEGVLEYETGGLCLSGVRCAKLGRRDAVFGWMAVPQQRGSVSVTLMARLLKGEAQHADRGEACPRPKISVYLINVDSGQAQGTVRFNPSAAPVNGYCTYSSVVTPMGLSFGSPGIYVEGDSDMGRDDVVLIDKVVVTPAESGAGPLPPKPAVAQRGDAPSAATAARIDAAAAWIRKHRIPLGSGRKQEPLK